MTDTNTLDSVPKFVDGALSKTQHATDAANALLRSGVESVVETSHQLRDGAQNASAKTVQFIREEPIKAVLIAAATGAALMALLGLAGRSSGRV